MTTSVEAAVKAVAAADGDWETEAVEEGTAVMAYSGDRGTVNVEPVVREMARGGFILKYVGDEGRRYQFVELGDR